MGIFYKITELIFGLPFPIFLLGFLLFILMIVLFSEWNKHFAYLLGAFLIAVFSSLADLSPTVIFMLAGVLLGASAAYIYVEIKYKIKFLAHRHR